MRYALLLVLAAIALPGCASTHNLHMYTPQEQAGMTSEGSIPTMITPSELRELAKNAGKSTKPSGHVSYCNAGLASVSARGDALNAISRACGGNGRYTVVRAIPMLDAVKTVVGTSCTRSEMIIFRCEGGQPK